MREPADFDIEELLANRGWVRSLAIQLVGDADLADDIVQQTWLAALENPPRERAARHGWLRSVVRRLGARAHREAAVRRRHDVRVPAREPLPGPDELVEIAETQQMVVAMVLELEEPYRSTILGRYFLDRSAEDIARRRGVPAATVRTQLRRGLQRLRERLDRENGGDRRKCLRSLLPLLALPAAGGPASAAVPLAGIGSSVGWGVLIVSAAKIWILLVIVALVAGFLIRRTGSEPANEEAGGPAATSAASGERGSSEVAVTPFATTTDLGTAFRPAVIGRLIAKDTGEPIADFPVAIRWAGDGQEPGTTSPESIAECMSLGDGGFRFDSLEPGACVVSPGTEDRRELRAEPVPVTVDPSHPIEVVLECEVRWFVAGTLVLAGTKDPVPGCRLQLSVRGQDTIDLGETDDLGRFRGERSVPTGAGEILASGHEVQWLSSRGSQADLNARLFLAEIQPGWEDTHQLVLEHPWNGIIEGTVVDVDERPIGGARVRVLSGHHSIESWEHFWRGGMSMGAPERTTGHDGRFRFERMPCDRPLSLAATGPGRAPALSGTFRIENGVERRTIQLEFPGTIRGTVRYTDGRPVEGAKIHASPPGGGPGHGFPAFTTILDGQWNGPKSNAEGAFEVSVSPGRYLVGARTSFARLGADSSRSANVDVLPGGEVDVAIELVPGGELEIAGRVVDGNAAPIVKGVLHLLNVEKERVGVGTSGLDFEGRFRFSGLNPGSYSVVVHDALEESWFPLEVTSESPPIRAGTTDCTIVHDPVRCRLELRVVDDETGEPVTAHFTIGAIDPFGNFALRSYFETDADGRRRIVLLPGPTGIWIHARGHAPVLERVDLESTDAEAPHPTLEVRLPRGRVASGVVRDARGKPVPDVLVGVALPWERWPWLLQETVVEADSNGEFTLDSLPLEGGHVTVVRHRSPIPGTLTDAGGDRITIVVPD